MGEDEVRLILGYGAGGMVCGKKGVRVGYQVVCYVELSCTFLYPAFSLAGRREEGRTRVLDMAVFLK